VLIVTTLLFLLCKKIAGYGHFSENTANVITAAGCFGMVFGAVFTFMLTYSLTGFHWKELDIRIWANIAAIAFLLLIAAGLGMMGCILQNSYLPLPMEIVVFTITGHYGVKYRRYVLSQDMEYCYYKYQQEHKNTLQTTTTC